MKLNGQTKFNLVVLLFIVAFIVAVISGRKENKKEEIKEQKRIEKRQEIQMNNPLAREIKEEKKPETHRFTVDELKELYSLHDYIKNGGRITEEIHYIATLDGILQQEIEPEEAPLEFYIESTMYSDYMVEKKDVDEARRILELSKKMLTKNLGDVYFPFSTDKMENTGNHFFSYRPQWWKTTYPDKPDTYFVKYTDGSKRKKLKFSLRRQKDVFGIFGLDEVIVPYFYDLDKNKAKD